MTEREVREKVWQKTPIDQIIQISNYGDFWLVMGTAGGDMLCYRFYKDGSWCEE